MKKMVQLFHYTIIDNIVATSIDIRKTRSYQRHTLLHFRSIRLKHYNTNGIRITVSA